MNRIIRSLSCALLLIPAVAPAQLLPLDVDVTGDTATVRVGSSVAPLLDMRLDFDDAEGLTPASLGIDADIVATAAGPLLARLGSGQVSIPSGLPVLLTVQPPTLGGLRFERRVHVEVHTHALPYTAGSRFRLFKAPLGGAFRDVTTAVEPGSVRTRGTTGGFSQFVVVYDLRPTGTVVAQKFAWLRDRVDRLSPSEAGPLRGRPVAGRRERHRRVPRPRRDARRRADPGNVVRRRQHRQSRRRTARGARHARVQHRLPARFRVLRRGGASPARTTGTGGARRRARMRACSPA